MPKKISKELIISLHLDGFTQRDIAFLVDCSVSTVNKVVNEYISNDENNHYRSFRELSDKDIDKILYYYEKGYPITFISRLLNIKASKIISVLIDYL